MSSIANPINALLEFQQALNAGMAVKKLGVVYIERYDEISSGKRYSYAKVVEGVVQALATFGQERPIKGVDCYSVNYAVSEKHRGRGLAVEIVNKGIEELKKEFSRSKRKNFYVDAIIDATNIHSINVAKKLFPSIGKAMNDAYSGTPSLHFYRLVIIR